jgi:hypothetical protein
MAKTGGDPSTASVGDWLRRLIRGTDDPRLRATWRVLLAYPVLWVLTGDLLTGNLQAAVPVIPHGPPLGGLTQSVLHAAFLVVVLAGWARYVDREPLSAYGVSATPEWVRDTLVGVVALVVGQGVWLAFGSLVGGTAVTLALSPPAGSLLLAVAVPIVALALHAVVQQVVFFRVVGKAAAEGLHARGLTPARATFGAVPVMILFFVLMHQLPSGLRLLDLAIAGAVFGLLYLQTGDLALGSGVHFGALYAGGVVFATATNAGPAVFRVAGPQSDVLGVLGQYGFPRVVLAYLLLLGWLRWRGALGLEEDVASSPG